MSEVSEETQGAFGGCSREELIAEIMALRWSLTVAKIKAKKAADELNSIVNR